MQASIQILRRDYLHCVLNYLPAIYVSHPIKWLSHEAYCDTRWFVKSTNLVNLAVLLNIELYSHLYFDIDYLRSNKHVGLALNSKCAIRADICIYRSGNAHVIPAFNENFVSA